jgi:hypothetical protein
VKIFRRQTVLTFLSSLIKRSKVGRDLSVNEGKQHNEEMLKLMKHIYVIKRYMDRERMDNMKIK